MTENNLLSFALPAVRRKKVVAAFDGGRLTSDGGVVLLAEAERRLGLWPTRSNHWPTGLAARARRRPGP